MRVAAALLICGVLLMLWLKHSPRTADPDVVHRTINENRNRR